MTTLVLVLLLSPIFGGQIEATLTFKDEAACRRLTTALTKFSVNHVVKQDCAPKK